MARQILLLVCLSMVVNAGFGLQCYTCNSQNIEACKKGSQELTESTCGLGHPDYLQFCLIKVVYDNLLKKDNILSGCEIAIKPVVLNKNITQCQTDSRYQVKDCIVCDTDLCNFVSSASRTTSFITMSLPFFYIVYKLILH